jgi:cellulose synthase/poly-beta-1,6-N-acetylglucosamine synthase-like glycosyltransferase
LLSAVLVAATLFPLVALNLVFLTEALLGLPRVRDATALLDLARHDKVVVLMPAHDEETGLAAVLSANRANIPAGMRIMVVADNCSDRTADIARTAGAEVVERRDLERRGKGFALAFGRDQLASTPPECVVIVDADTIAAPGAIASLAAQAMLLQRPVQGAYIIDPLPDDPPLARYSAASFFIKNVVRQLGAKRLGAPAVLTGSGMAFPWSVFAELPLDTGHVAEDLMLGVNCTLKGRDPAFAADAWIVGSASSAKGTEVQRRRWESGFLQVGQDYVGPLLGYAIRSRRGPPLWLALHLMTPPLVLLLVIDVAGILLAAVGWTLGIGAAPWVTITGLTLTTSAVVPIALALHGRLDLIRDWQGVPRYVFWKFALSLSTLVRRERTWIRTDRD